jgi:SAM-dependent methyltransferase
MSIFNIFKKKQNVEEMVNETENQIDPNVTEFDSNYLSDSPELVGYPSAEIQNLIYDIALDGIQPGESIVDYGCGRADIALLLGPELDYTGIDFNPVMQNVSIINPARFINDDWFNSDVTAEWALNILSLTIPYTEEQIANPFEYSIKTIDHMMEHCTIGSVIVCIDSDVEEYVEGSIAISATELVRYYGNKYRMLLDKSFNTNMFKLVIFK